MMMATARLSWSSLHQAEMNTKGLGFDHELRARCKDKGAIMLHKMEVFRRKVNVR